jgi:protein-S-isoprenylcysteine O-methyltransferase Ste14
MQFMPALVRATLIALSLVFVAVGLYHRIRSSQSGESLDRSKEGWLLLITVRLAGLITLGATAAWFWNPSWFAWATVPVAGWVHWLGAAGYAFGVVWLCWMFISLGTNLTDTVVTRRNAHFVGHGPYRYVRNPMYTGILILGFSLGLALGTWLVPLAAGALFLMMARRTRIEERYLIARFGDQHRDYMARVGRFFPRSRPPSQLEYRPERLATRSRRRS